MTTLAIPAFVPPAGKYFKAQNVAISCATVLTSNPTLVQKLANQSFSSGSKNSAFASANQQGSVLICMGYLSATGTFLNTPTISDSQGNSWQVGVIASSTLGGAGHWRVFLAYALNASAGNNTVSVANSDVLVGGVFYLAEFNGATFSFNQHASANGSSASESSGNVTTTASELLFGLGFTIAGTQTEGSGFTLGSKSAGEILWEYQVAATTGPWAATATISSSGAWTCVLGTFSCTAQQAIISYTTDGSSPNPVGTTGNLVATGDSITLAAGITPYTSLLQIANTGGPWVITNSGINGETLATMRANGASVTDAQIVPGEFNVNIVWGGTNDFAIDGTTVAAVYANLVAYCQDRKAAGWARVLVETMLTRQGTNPVGGETLDVDKNAFNALILANWQTFCDGVISFVGTPLGVDGGWANATWFGDGVHPTQAGVTTYEAPLASAQIISNAAIVEHIYSAPILVSQSETLKAAASAFGFTPSSIASGAYIIATRSTRSK